MASREVSLSWSGKGETHWGLTRKIGPWKTTPQDKNFLQTGGPHAGHGNWFARFNPKPYQSTMPPTKEQRYRSGNVVYDTMEYEPNSYEKYVYGSSKRIVMDRGIKDGIGKLGVKFVGPPSFGAVGSGTQVYDEGGHDQSIAQQQSFPPRYTTRPTSMDYIDSIQPPHLKNRRILIPNQQISAPAPFEMPVREPVPEPWGDESPDVVARRELEPLREKVQADAVVANAKSPARINSAPGYQPPQTPSSPPPKYEAKMSNRIPTRGLARYNPYSETKRHVPRKTVGVDDKALMNEATSTRVKRKALNQEGGVKKASRTGEAPTLKRKALNQEGGVKKAAKVGSSYLSGLGSKRKAEGQGGVGKRVRVAAAEKAKPTMKINTRVAKVGGPKATKKVGTNMPIPQRRSKRNK